MKFSFVSCGALFSSPFLIYLRDEAGWPPQPGAFSGREVGCWRGITQYPDRKTETALDGLHGGGWIEKNFTKKLEGLRAAQKGGSCSAEIRMLVLTGVGAYRPTLSAELLLLLQLLLDLCCSLGTGTQDATFWCCWDQGWHFQSSDSTGSFWAPSLLVPLLLLLMVLPATGKKASSSPYLLVSPVASRLAPSPLL